MLDDIRPLKQYLFSDKPLSGGNRRSLAGYIDLLVERIASQKRKRGRPSAAPPTRGRPSGLSATLRGWWRTRRRRGENSTARRRVPGDVIDVMIREACEEAARAFDVPVRTVRAANVRSALKTGRFVVP